MSLVSESVVWATEIVLLPRDPNVVFGGTIVTHNNRVVPTIIRPLPINLIPINQKKDDEETALLKRILQGLQGKPVQPQPMASFIK